MLNNFPNLPFEDLAADACGRKAPSLSKQSSPWIRLTGTYVKSVEAREEMTSRYFADIYFHVELYGPRVVKDEKFEGAQWATAVVLLY